MNVEIWVRNGTIAKYNDVKSLKIGMHNNVGDGKTYISVQINDKELLLNNTLVTIREEYDWNEKEKY